MRRGLLILTAGLAPSLRAVPTGSVVAFLSHCTLVSHDACGAGVRGVAVKEVLEDDVEADRRDAASAWWCERKGMARMNDQLRGARAVDLPAIATGRPYPTR